MSDWHDELEFALLPLEDAKIDSDCMTFVISNALSEQGIFHQCRIGYAEDRLSRIATALHCWIELEQGWCVSICGSDSGWVMRTTSLMAYFSHPTIRAFDIKALRGWFHA